MRRVAVFIGAMCLAIAPVMPQGAMAATSVAWTPIPVGPQVGFEGWGFASGACRLVGFGGNVTGSGGVGTYLYDQARGTWTTTPIGRRDPGWRAHPRLAWHPGIVRMVLFGGRSYRGALQDTWAYDPVRAAWAPLVTSCRKGVCPPVRYAHGMVWSSVLNRVLVFGGDYQDAAGNDVSRNDLWAFDGVAWSQVVTKTAPPPRSLFGMAEDPTTGLIVVYGGIRSTQTGYVPLHDTWVLDPVARTWRELPTLADPEVMAGVGMAWLPSIGRLVVAGGSATVCTDVRTGVWALDLAAGTWTKLTTTGGTPTGRNIGTLVTNTCNGSVILYGSPGNAVPPLTDDYAWSLR